MIGRSEWRNLRKCISVSRQIAATFMTRTGETAEARSPRGPDLKTFRMIGNARCAGPLKKCSGHWLVRDPLKMNRNTLAKPASFGIKYDRFSETNFTAGNLIKREEEQMDRYVCTVCGYVYDPEQGDPDNGVAAGTKWEDVPGDWECPVCGASKDDFEKE